ncbi:uncharacterized protein [Palaemon carinicauda]|uniref:uncharacterized protein isoform X2 n=1 Tax=Palaemon carinicauda TaxID=392227 RepID=UPI0035B6584D
MFIRFHFFITNIHMKSDLRSVDRIFNNFPTEFCLHQMQVCCTYLVSRSAVDLSVYKSDIAPHHHITPPHSTVVTTKMMKFLWLLIVVVALVAADDSSSSDGDDEGGVQGRTGGEAGSQRFFGPGLGGAGFGGVGFGGPGLLGPGIGGLPIGPGLGPVGGFGLGGGLGGFGGGYCRYWCRIYGQYTCCDHLNPNAYL